MDTDVTEYPPTIATVSRVSRGNELTTRSSNRIQGNQRCHHPINSTATQSVLNVSANRKCGSFPPLVPIGINRIRPVHAPNFTLPTAKCTDIAQGFSHAIAEISIIRKREPSYNRINGPAHHSNLICNSSWFNLSLSVPCPDIPPAPIKPHRLPYSPIKRGRPIILITRPRCTIYINRFVSISSAIFEHWHSRWKIVNNWNKRGKWWFFAFFFPFLNTLVEKWLECESRANIYELKRRVRGISRVYCVNENAFGWMKNVFENDAWEINVEGDEWRR